MLGDNIKRIRMSKNISQAELSEKMNVARTTISSWETNRTEPTMGNIEQLAKIFNCRKSALIGESQDDYYDRLYEENKKEILISSLVRMASESTIEDIEQAIEYLEFRKYKPLIDSILGMKLKKQEEPQ